MAKYKNPIDEFCEALILLPLGLLLGGFSVVYRAFSKKTIISIPLFCSWLIFLTLGIGIRQDFVHYYLEPKYFSYGQLHALTECIDYLATLSFSVVVLYIIAIYLIDPTISTKILELTNEWLSPRGQTQKQILEVESSALITGSQDTALIEMPTDEYSGVDLHQSRMHSRLIILIKDLTRMATINLLIGAGSTGFALVIMWVIFSGFHDFQTFQANSSLADRMGNLLQLYAPRLTLVVFIEIFAFFFLRLYKSNLEDIKFFHNEP